MLALLYLMDFLSNLQKSEIMVAPRLNYMQNYGTEIKLAICLPFFSGDPIKCLRKLILFSHQILMQVIRHVPFHSPVHSSNVIVQRRMVRVKTNQIYNEIYYEQIYTRTSLEYWKRLKRLAYCFRSTEQTNHITCAYSFDIISFLLCRGLVSSLSLARALFRTLNDVNKVLCQGAVSFVCLRQHTQKLISSMSMAQLRIHTCSNVADSFLTCRSVFLYFLVYKCQI